MIRAAAVLLGILFCCGAGCSSQSCPAVPLHCACVTAVNGGDPVCIDGQWVCQCIDGGADAAAE
jgi:hypothetical protein